MVYEIINNLLFFAVILRRKKYKGTTLLDKSDDVDGKLQLTFTRGGFHTKPTFARFDDERGGSNKLLINCDRDRHFGIRIHSIKDNSRLSDHIANLLQSDCLSIIANHKCQLNII